MSHVNSGGNSKRKKKIHVGKRQQYRRIADGVKSIISEINVSSEKNNDQQFAIVHQDIQFFQPCSSNDFINTSVTNISQINEKHSLVDSHHSLSGCFESSSSDDSDFHEDNQISVDKLTEVPGDLKSQLCTWATVKHNVTQSALDDLLKILHPLHPELPLSSKTLLKTPVICNSVKLESGEFIYLGVQTGLHKILLHNPGITDNHLSIRFNVDGLPLFHSCNIQLWPILGLVTNIPHHPFVIALFCGTSKPLPLDIFLGEFVEEMSKLLEVGIVHNNKNYSISIHSFNCDAPARAFIKCTKLHSGYSACDKCNETGEYFQGRVILRNINASKRTDLQFKLLRDEDHHTGITPLSKLEIGLVSRFPIDYMHAICLGVMRKLLHSWVGGNLAVRLSGRLVIQISQKLVSLKYNVPLEFNRKPRPLSELARWKATEFRMFLIYLGPLVLKEILPLALYENFLLLHSATTLFCSEKHLKNLGCELGGKFLNTFIEHCEVIYGREYLIYNIHLLCHLVDDVKQYGCLDNFSTFPFENYLGQLKKLVRSSKKPLQQIFRRLHEIDLHNDQFLSKKNFCFVSNELITEALPNGYDNYKAFKKLIYKSFTLFVHSVRNADCYCLIKSKTVLQVHCILVNNLDSNNIVLYGKKFEKYESLYNYPMKSEKLKIFIVGNLSKDFDIYTLNDIVCKCVLLPYENEDWVCSPIVHALNS